jgi:DNA-binding GntR family transcriptional regulator
VLMNSAGVPRWRQLADQLAGEIRSGARPPGSKLPSVAEHTAAGISQTTTMRAYRELSSQGLTVTVQGSGTYVIDPLPSPVERPSSLADLEARIKRLEDQMTQLLAQQ